MREIIFKAKTEKNGEWVEGNYGFFNAKKLHYITTAEDKDIRIDESTLCQYTGFTDKNGNKIWENDVLNKVDTNALGWHRERKCKVSFDKRGYWLLTTEYGERYLLGEFASEQLEVIGNIFDNPELMEA